MGWVWGCSLQVVGMGMEEEEIGGEEGEHKGERERESFIFQKF